MKKKEEIICVGTTLFKIVNRNCHYLPMQQLQFFDYQIFVALKGTEV
ncbi:MAG: hypothetical protein SPF43_13290 [Bacteroidales bacterium]|nr:hypothetical protein [Parabacteroides sp.]MDY5623972.1 hypothetical protein [Bacteroidales bacterium]